MSAEWCQHDDIVLHWQSPEGENVAVRCKFEGLTLPEVFREWHKHKAGNVRLTGNTAQPTILVLGPPCPWRVSRIEANRGYELDQEATIEYLPNQSVTFTLSQSEAA